MLGRQGVAAELIERTNAPRDVVCGGFVGWDALAALKQLRIDPWALGAQPIHTVRIISADRTVEARLPHQAAGLSRRVLDEALIVAAARAGAAVTRGVAVKAADDERYVRLDSGEIISADALLLATGKHELRGLSRPKEIIAADPVVGFRTGLAASPSLPEALQGIIELHLFDNGYGGLLLQEDGSANFCISVSRERLNRAGGIDALLLTLAKESPHLAQRLEGSRDPRWETIAGVPYGWRAPSTLPGVFRLGDQGAVIASLAGDGVAIALTSGIAAAAALTRKGPGGAEAFQKDFARRARHPLAVAAQLRRWVETGSTRDPILRLLKFAPFLLSAGARLTRITSG
jgi:flavin-dependent dehydrogenase